METKERKDRINKYIKELSKHLSKLDESKQEIGKQLIENIAFMNLALEELREQILEKGYVEEYKNGREQYGTKQSSEVNTYNQIITNFNKTVKQYVDLFDKTTKSEINEDDSLSQFFNKSKATKR